jgi:aryl-phospho-beta-D-glucosidase BglC (GH1 family)
MKKIQLTNYPAGKFEKPAHKQGNDATAIDALATYFDQLLHWQLTSKGHKPNRLRYLRVFLLPILTPLF